MPFIRGFYRFLVICNTPSAFYACLLCWLARVVNHPTPVICAILTACFCRQNESVSRSSPVPLRFIAPGNYYYCAHTGTNCQASPSPLGCAELSLSAVRCRDPCITRMLRMIQFKPFLMKSSRAFSGIRCCWFRAPLPCQRGGRTGRFCFEPGRSKLRRTSSLRRK